ncbi:13636_t:CDS:2 [Funneliformis caledonium]|uniref:13636_t:CDS:1 n=1 Tax=Funneliformis caledonium TaxID=1117310 RepID=A0A9N9BY94_9GLOM|nr:13636_t:CDS:2 [Funneliformis caledonium]
MSKRISMVLFGLTGQGKSSIANMLIQGDIFQKGNVFEINDSAVGATITVNFSSNEEFIVYDTIGVGETSYGSVPHRKAVREIRNYFSKCKMPLNYIAFVKKKGRFTEEDRKMFKIFKEIFEGGETNFIIIITNSGPKWVEDYTEKIKENLGDHPIIPLCSLNYVGIKLEVLDSIQAIPVIGQPISSVFCKKSDEVSS